MQKKIVRQNLIKEVITEGRISSQEDLAAALEKRGVTVAQATLSRDIKDLKVTKLHDEDGYFYSLSRPGSMRRQVFAGGDFFDSIESIEFSSVIAVFKTRPGHASMVSSFIDAGSLPESAGTLAGDDTILLVMREGASREDLIKSLGKLFKNIRKKVVA